MGGSVRKMPSMRQWVLVLLVAAGPAWGQSEKEVQAAVGKELDAYTLCLKQHAHDLAKKSDDAEGVIVGKAIAECADERQVLLEASQQPPLNLSVSDANDQINQMVLSLQDRMIRTIHEARGA